LTSFFKVSSYLKYIGFFYTFDLNNVIDEFRTKYVESTFKLYLGV